MEKAPEKPYSMPGCKGRFFVRGKKSIIWYKVGNRMKSCGLIYNRKNRKIAGDIIAESESPEHFRNENHPVTIIQAFKIFIEQSKNTKHKNTLQQYIYSFKSYITEDLILNDDNKITLHIENNLLKRNHASKTATVNLIRLSSFFNYCIEREWMRKNPIIKTLKPKKTEKIIEIYTPEEIKKIFDYWQEKNYQFYLLIQTIYICALRKNEAVNMEWDQVLNTDGDYRQSIMFEKSKFGNKPDKFPLTDKLKNIFDQVESRKESKGKIFNISDYSRTIDYRFNKGLEALNIPKYTVGDGNTKQMNISGIERKRKAVYGRCIHTLRKTRISEWLYTEKLTPQIVSKLSRDSLDTVMKYYAYTDSDELGKYVN